MEMSPSSGPEVPPPLKLTMQFTFSMLAHALRNPMRKSSPFARPTLNPHITIMLTFLATAVKDPQALAVLERFIPWVDLSAFLTAIPRRVMYREQQKERSESAVLGFSLRAAASLSPKTGAFAASAGEASASTPWASGARRQMSKTVTSR